MVPTTGLIGVGAVVPTVDLGGDMESVREKADRVFAAAAAKIVQGQKAMHADHAAKHLLRSGNTIVEAVRIYEAETSTGIDECADALAQRLESRGGAWNKAMGDVRDALAAHTAKGVELISSSTGIAARGDPERLVTPLLEEANGRLEQRLRDFAEGWTSPKGRKWNDRHPVLYAIAMMVIGGIVTAAIGAAVAKMNTAKAPPAALVVLSPAKGAHH